jgi:hypothetical protein
MKEILNFSCHEPGITDFNQCVSEYKVTNYGTDYDYYSIMHYGLDA